jgi:methionine synthase I (cobalamin-dependent)
VAEDVIRGRGRFLDALARRPLLLDAAMGTRLIALGLDLGRDDPALWNLSRPEDVESVHRLDVEAGADALLTNTFGANRAWLGRYGRADSVAAINRRAFELARRVAGPHRFVLGSIGPTAAAEPDAYPEQAEALAGAGVDALILETHDAQAPLGLRRLQGATGLPLLVSLHRWPAGPLADFVRLLADLGASAVGSNCLPGVEPTLRLTQRLRADTDLPLIAKPSAGLPGESPTTPEALAAGVPRLLALGVRLLGGCCGTTEAHVAALRAALDRESPGDPR